MLLAEASAGSTGRAPRATATERARRQVAALVVVFYLLLIFEGALRKWLLISWGQPLFFIRDPFVLAIYWLAVRYGFYPRGNLLAAAALAFGFLGLVLIVVQATGVAATIDKWPLLAAYGWRNYFLYIPLPFVIGEALRPADLERIARIAFLLAVPIAALVVLQFRAPLEAPINVGFGASLAQQFHGLSIDMNHTRPMGTFTSDVGQKEFVVTSLAMLIALWVMPAARRYLARWQMIVVTVALLTCLALSGSRGAMLASGLVMLGAVASAAVVRRVAARTIVVPALIVVLAVALFPILFPEGYSAFLTRWTEAQVSETQVFAWGFFGRVFYAFYDFFHFLGSTPFSGYGLGLAGNASLILGVTIPGFTGWAESDWSRHIVDLGPLLGMTFIGFRIALVIWLAGMCVSGARRSGNPLPIILFASCAFELLTGQITGHGTVNGFTWLFTGLTLVAARTEVAQPMVQSARGPAIAATPFPNLLR
ncbi:MAG: hypothetical protein JO184_11635 [Gammaproteobacteria bacterium]|nr:hypothetical protein [Gammaproteobacteria bacterium]MBV8403432.1 hypothetical protein [Gammaproteobacteria bacterium]